MRFSRAGLSATGRAWADAIEGHSRSGITIRDFCREHELSEPSFYDWRRRLRQRQADLEVERAAAVQRDAEGSPRDGDEARRRVERPAAKGRGASIEESAETDRSPLFVPVAVTATPRTDDARGSDLDRDSHGVAPRDAEPEADRGERDAASSQSPGWMQVTSPAGWKIAVPEFANAAAVRSLLGIVNELPARNDSAKNDSAKVDAVLAAEARRC